MRTGEDRLFSADAKSPQEGSLRHRDSLIQDRAAQDLVKFADVTLGGDLQREMTCLCPQVQFGIQIKMPGILR